MAHDIIHINLDGTAVAQKKSDGSLHRFQMILNNVGGIGLRRITEDEFVDQAGEQQIYDPSQFQHD